MNKKWIFFSLIIGLLMIPNISLAEENAISVQPHPHKNAINNSDKTAFNLLVKPNETYELLVDVKNAGKDNTNITIAVVDAETNPSGAIGYTNHKMKKVGQVDKYLSEIVTFEDEKIQLKAGETKTLKFKLKTANQEFKGIRLGALFIVNEVSQSENKKMFKNQFSYSIPVSIQQNDTQIPAELNLSSIKSINENGKNVIEVLITNPKNNIISEAEMSVTVKKDKKVVVENQMEKIMFAPTAHFPYKIDWKDNKVIPGRYEVSVKINSPFGDWLWSKELVIKKEKAKKLNQQALGVSEQPNYVMWILIGILAGSIVIIVLLKKRS